MKKEISISKGNTKMGLIKSVSLPPLVTCSPEACKCCGKKCYAHKIARLRMTVAAAYQRNLDIYKEDPDMFFKQVDLAMTTSSLFRIHVSGDFPDYEYMVRMIEVVNENPQCEVLCFTKRFEWVNKWLEENVHLPKNLHLIFSAWKGLHVSNPFSLPECHIIYRDGTTTAPEDKPSWVCKGNCTECKVTDYHGCWKLNKGECVLIMEH